MANIVIKEMFLDILCFKLHKIFVDELCDILVDYFKICTLNMM
mgnify:CR=1 FL=1